MKSLTSIIEARAADDILYHFTNIDKTNSILNSNEFVLTSDMGSGSDAAHRKRNKAFYLSTTRHKLGGYNLAPYRGVMLVLDGNTLSYNYKIGAVDYWGLDYAGSGGGKAPSAEAEDRVYSDKPSIPNATKFIKEIHVLEPESFDTMNFKQTLRQVMIQAKQSNIPFYFYDNEKNFLLQHNPVDVPINKLKTPDAEKPEPFAHRYDFGRADLNAATVELIKKPTNQPLSRSGKILATGLTGNRANVIASKLHNDKGSKSVAFITKYMMDNKLSNTQDLVNHLQDKWYPVIYGER